jgi:hypothetical protein
MERRGMTARTRNTQANSTWFCGVLRLRVGVITEKRRHCFVSEPSGAMFNLGRRRRISIDNYYSWSPHIVIVTEGFVRI